MVNRLFSAINVSQGSAETCARCGGIFDNDFTVNYHEILLRKNFKNRLKFDRIMAMRLWPHFFGSPCIHGFLGTHYPNGILNGLARQTDHRTCSRRYAANIYTYYY